MINKFYKIIHNKYSRFFRFIFFLRYVFGLFVIATILFLSVPNYFNYEKRSETFKNHLIKNYDIKILKYEKIEFNSFLVPYIEFKNVFIKFNSFPSEFNIKKFRIYPKFLSIYNYQNFQSNKIVLKNSNIILETSNLNFFVKKLINQKNNLYIDDLNIKINDAFKSLVSIEKVKFTNYGYKKNIIEGNIFDKKFIAKINNDLNNINFKLIKSGLIIDIYLDDQINKHSINGVFKSKILNTKLKFNFSYDEKFLNIYNSFFRNKYLSFENESFITLKPFLYSNSKFQIEDIDLKIFKKLKIDEILKPKNLLKQINTKNEISFNSKKFSRSFFDKLNLKLDLSYGRLNYLKKLSILDDVFQCKGNINLLEEFPLLFFDCSIIVDAKSDLLKKFNIDTKKDDKTFNLSAKGNLSILNQKINFNAISLNENYKATNEDLNYFKKNFENILFDKDFVGIFNLNKIKEFILEVS
ncbi:hypothetical protein IDH09_04510 [Pelagibacterales bacterium SAG-MED28]|nr:hypothetical protein [Pelagibacterales bacterium SAG-MED28]